MQEHFQNSLEFTQTSHNNINLQIPLPNFSSGPIQSVPHNYCFMTGRHGEFLYLKLGAAWFCFGLLVHSILTLSYQIIYFTQDSACRNTLLLTVEIMFPIYSLFILFFIFKYCNIVIMHYRGFARIMLMHAIGTSLAFWVYTIVRETQDAINMKSYYYKQEASKSKFDTKVLPPNSSLTSIINQTKQNSWTFHRFPLLSQRITSPSSAPVQKT